MHSILLRRLAPVLSRFTPAHRLLLVQFMRFGIVGTLGFVWDTAVVLATKPLVGPYVAGLISYVVAASINWLLNRIWTYAQNVHSAPHRQLVMFLLVNSIGLVLNRGVYFAIIATQPACRAWPYIVLPIAAGGLCGMFLNFSLSRRLVFR